MKNLIILILIYLMFACGRPGQVAFNSPDKRIEVRFGTNDSLSLYYSVTMDDSVIIGSSPLGFVYSGIPETGNRFEIVSVAGEDMDQVWRPVHGEKAQIRDHYHQARIRVKESGSPFRELELTFRVYNHGVAFNYTLLPFDGVSSLTIEKEKTGFRFEKDFLCYVSDRAQSEYRKVPLSEISKPAERPLVIGMENRYLALAEAALVDFARMKLVAGGENLTLEASLEGVAEVNLPYTTPWRVIMTGSTPGDLLENNDLLLNLNAPCALEDVSWIKPGKVIREVTLTTQGGLACVDFAAENGLQYVEFDAGWYGSEYDDSSDATTITVDPKRSPGPLDLHEVIRYADSKGIGIILYVNRRALEKQLDEILPLYKSWGVKGVKYGFVQVGNQEWTTWLHNAVKKAAEHQLMVDIHDEYRPTGFSRTYPNLMTQEGIRGDEESPSNTHTLITLFTRMLAGAGDNTICYYAPRVTEKMGGHVSQLAKSIMLYSPWQFLYWYDRPQGSPGKKGGAGASDGYIGNHAELDLFKRLPVVWDDTKVLEGSIGEYATLVRKSEENWYLGSLTGEKEKKVSLVPDFLTRGVNYEAIIYSHDPDAQSETKVKVEIRTVKYDDKMEFDLLPNSGLAIVFMKNPG